MIMICFWQVQQQGEGRKLKLITKFLFKYIMIQIQGLYQTCDKGSPLSQKQTEIYDWR